jgi:hypothetical protein
MNIEELKLVLDTIRQLSGDASTAVYAYFGLEFAKFVIGWAVSAWVVLTVVKTVAKAAGLGIDEAFMCECRDALRIGCRGELGVTERAETQRVIRQMIQEQNVQKRAN